MPEQYINVDQDKVLKRGRDQRVYQTIQAYMGGLFVVTLMISAAPGRYIEAGRRRRIRKTCASSVRNNQNQNVPLSALASRRFLTPEFTLRYNEYRSAQIFGNAIPDYKLSTGSLEDVFHQAMPHEMGFDYMGMSYQEQKARQGVPAWAVLLLSLLFVFLILATLYESWTFPRSRPASTPVYSGALATLWLRQLYEVDATCRRT